MGKKLNEYILNEFMKQEDTVQEHLSNFVEDEVILNIRHASDYKDPLEGIIIREDISLQPLNEEEMVEECEHIKRNVGKEILNNIIIDFIQGNHTFEGRTHELYNTLIKIDVMDSEKPVYYHMNKGDILNAWIFIGGDNVNAYLLRIDEKNVPSILRLSEIVLISISEEKLSKRINEMALMTSYSWLEAKIHSGVVAGLHLNQIKALLLSDLFKLKANQMKKM